MWFIENAWPPMMFCLILAALVFALAQTRPRRGLMTLSLVLLAACPGLLLFERLIVTEREQQQAVISRRIDALAAAFQKRDVPTVVSFFAEDQPHLRKAAESALSMVAVTHVAVKDVAVTKLDAKTLRSTFRANATLSSKAFAAGETSIPTRWKLDWQQREEQWVIIAVTRVNPIRDEEIPIFDTGH